ncbi:MAG: LPS export ABC transporter periplasmic protein LptC, partial [Candidatus Omnitrophota bacterium]
MEKLLRPKLFTNIIVALAVVSLGILSVRPIPAFAQDKGPLAKMSDAAEPITVTGDKVEFLHEKKKVIASENVVITYKDVKLTCNEVIVYLDTREAVAQGNVRITQQGALLTGDKINYNFETKRGTWINGTISAAPWHGRSKEVEKLSDKEIELRKGSISTCDLKKPHYRFQAREVKIFLDDKITAKNMTLFVGDMPIFYLPLYVHKLDSKRPQMSVMAGRDKDWGYYGLTAWRYFFGDDNRGDIRLDYRQKKGLAEGIDHYYSTKELGSGSAKFYFLNENDMTAYEKSG